MVAGKTKVRVCVSLGAILVVVLFITPVASALTYIKVPPYSAGPLWWNPYGFGNYVVFKHDLSVFPNDGSIGFHLGADTGPPSGALWLTAAAGFTGTAFTPSVTGTYTITYFFQIVGGNAQLYTMPFGQVSFYIQFRANLQDLTTYTWVSNGDVATTVWSGYMCCGGGVYQDLSGRVFSVQFSGYLTAGHRYGLLGYEYADMQLNWPTSGAWADGETDMTAKLNSVTAYIYTGGGGGCVLRDTQILTPSGYVPVQQLGEGDASMSYDLSTGSLIQTTVASITHSKARNIVSINNGTLWLTPYDQPIYMHNSTFTGWLKNPGELVAGDYIFDAVSGSWVFVYLVDQTSGSYKVYDLRTTGPNNFVANGILLDMK